MTKVGELYRVVLGVDRGEPPDADDELYPEDAARALCAERNAQRDPTSHLWNTANDTWVVQSLVDAFDAVEDDVVGWVVTDG